MQLSLTHPCFSTLLLLLASNLLLWEEVAALPMCSVRNGRCFASVREMLDRAVDMSEYINKQAVQMFVEFDNQYSQSRQLISKNLKKCHTVSLEFPKPGSKGMQIHPLKLLKLVGRLLGAWKAPLHHLVNHMPSLEDVPDTILVKAREVEQMNTGLLEGVRTILSQIQNGHEEDENYLGWPGLPSLQSDKKDVRLFTVYNLMRCTCRDAQKVETALKMVKCKLLKQDDC